MKKILLVLTTLFSLTVFGQIETDGIKKALQKGDAELLSRHFDAAIDVKLPNKDELQDLSKTNATEVLSAFFGDVAVSNFEATSQREMNGTMYLAGKLYTSKKDYNITLMIKNKDGKASIITVRIN